MRVTLFLFIVLLLLLPGLQPSPRAVTREAMVQSALTSAQRAEEIGLGRDKIILSAKISAVQDLIAVYRDLAKRCDYTIHLGLTEAGMGSKGIVASTAGMGILLQQGIGDTIRVSLTDEPEKEVEVGKEILRSLGMAQRSVEIIACPTCGRLEVDLFSITNQLEEAVKGIKKPVKVALLGCVVNGPGEASEADIGIAAGKGVAILYRKGEVVRKIKEEEIVPALLEEIQNFVPSEEASVH